MKKIIIAVLILAVLIGCGFRRAINGDYYFADNSSVESVK